MKDNKLNSNFDDKMLFTKQKVTRLAKIYKVFYKIYAYTNVNGKEGKGILNKTIESILARLACKKHKLIYDYIDKNLGERRFIPYKRFRAVRNDIDDQKIWICWLQGEDSMPELVKICYKQLIKNSGKHEVILLTFDNLPSYLDIDKEVLDKVGKYVTYTAFTNFLRLNLLALYGGMWIDSTYLVTKPIDDEIFNMPFYTLHKKISMIGEKITWLVSKRRWTGNLMCARPGYGPILEIRNLYCSYWDDHTDRVEYLFYDNTINYVYCNNVEFKRYIDNLPLSNEYSNTLSQSFGHLWNEDNWNLWLKTTSFFKLTYKRNVPKEIDGKLTNCGFFYKYFSE